jgi:uncharacterized protein
MSTLASCCRRRACPGDPDRQSAALRGVDARVKPGHDNEQRWLSATSRETKLLPAALAGVAEDGGFEGYASLFGVADLGKDLVVPGAFAECLARRGSAGVRMLWQHDPAEPIGRWLSLAGDGRGLRVRGRLNLAVARAREIHALMREGAIDGLSIGFRVERARTDRAGLRRLEKLDLWEISVVTFPMQPGARIAALSAHERPPTGATTERGESLVLAIRRAAQALSCGLPRG